MQLELRKSEILAVFPYRAFVSLNPIQQKNIAVKVLERRRTPASNFIADQILMGNTQYVFVVADDIPT